MNASMSASMTGQLRRPMHVDIPPAEGPASLPMMTTPRKLGNGRASPTSPLKLFGQAKKKINDIFIDIADYVTQSVEFLKAIDESEGVITPEQREHVNKYMGRVTGIREIIGRDRMKVAFFGRTSNGKSTVINAMLQKQILPTGMGHTTNCFLQVEGTDSADAYLETDDKQEPFSIQSISDRASAISQLRAEPNTVIKICWPKDRCPLLKDDVILVDSPGIDINPDLDVWIDEFCLDADVFVLVANAESTLMQTEKNFFHKVSAKLSKPNVFILNNRWDASVLEPEYMDEVKKQHMDRNVQFLADELSVTTAHEAKDRVYFVSAREALIVRLQASGVQPGTPGTPGGQLLTGFQDRLFAFQNFEKKFEECISQSAVTTKFMQHTSNGKLITSDLRAVMEEVAEKSSEKKFSLEKEFRETEDRLDMMSRDLGLLSSEIRDRILQTTQEVERKVALVFVDEVKRLAILVDEFEKPFHPDYRVLQNYKKELHFHIEESLTRNLHARCSSFVHQVIDVTNHEIQERLTALLPDEARSQAAGLMPLRDFEPAYKLDCRNLCADFQEDIQFRFSLGITSLMTRFLGPRGTRSVLMGGSDTIPPMMPLTPQTPSNEQRRGVGHAGAQEDAQMFLAMIAKFTTTSAGPSVATLAIASMVGKSLGWKVIGVCAVLYGSVYLYERLMWTNKAKERSFKSQYVGFARQKLRLIVDMMSANCSHQVKQELQATFSNLAHLVDMSKGELQSQLSTLKQSMGRLDELGGKAKKLRNNANYVDSELNAFIQEFLKPDSRL